MAISKAASAAVTPLIRLLPGVYGFGLTVDVTTSSPLMIIATGATVAGDVALRVSSGVNVQVRGGAFVGSTYAVQCTSTGSLTSLQLADASLSASTENTTLVDVASCFVRAATSSFDATMINAAAILVESSGGFSGDRLRVHGNRAQPVTIGGTFVTRASVQITNSLLEDVYIDIYATDTTDPGSSLAFGNNTIVGSGVICRTGSGAAHLSTVFDNNIVSARVGANSIEPAPRCVFRNNVAYPQTTPLPGNIIGDPLFAAPLSGDYHVVNGSPAIDAAVATSSFPTFKPDLDGTARPRGAAPDIGAFER